MSINLEKLIVCPIEKFVEIALKLGYKKDQITQLADELMNSESDGSKNFKQDYKRILDREEFYNSPAQKERRKKSSEWRGSRAF